MTDVQHQHATQPHAIYAEDEPAEALWIRAYQGEILGEVLFGRIAEQLHDPERRYKMEILSSLERRTKEAMIPTLERAGISTDPDPETLVAAESMADASADMPWVDLMGSFEPITTQYAAMYGRIGELDPAEQATADLLVAHEFALRDFGRKEVIGDVDSSLHAIMALPHMQ